MTILLLRHVHAGDRSTWNGDDRIRPISPRGQDEAQALVDTLSPWPLARIITSPYARCVGSVLPLAEARSLEVEEDDALAEGCRVDLLRATMHRYATDDVLLCSHGDVVEAIVTDLAAQGVDVGHEPEWPKASTWVLENLLDTPRARYLPPPI